MRRNLLYSIAFITMISILPIMAGCTANERAKQYGGTMQVNLPPGQKLVNATWKEGSQLWYLMRPMREGEKPEVVTFKEDSSFGLVEGTVVFTESASK